MRFRVLMAAALLAACTRFAAAAEPWDAVERERERAVMFYFSKSFGADTRGRELPLSYGLRLQQSSPLLNAARIDLFDLRLEGGLQARLLNGALQLNAFNDKDGDGKDSSEESSDDEEDLREWSARNRGKLITFSILGAAAVACGLEWGICKSSDRPRYEEPDPTPGPGLGRGPG